MIKNHIRKVSLKKMFFPFLLILITLYLFREIPFYNALKPIKIERLSQVEAVFEQERYFVDLSISTLYYSGYDYLVNGKVSGSYYYAIEDGICYYFLISREAYIKDSSTLLTLKDVRIQGKIESGENNLKELILNMAEDLSWTSAELRKVSSLFIINETEYLHSKTILMIGVNSAILIISCFLFFYELSFIVFPLLHPACIFLRRYGSSKQQVDELEDELNREIRLRCKDLIVTKKYLVEISGNHLKVLPLEQILWAYKHSNFHQFRLFSNKLTYTLRVISKKSGKLISTFQPKSDVDMVLQYLEDYFPDVLVGYSKENEKKAKKKNWI